MTTHISSDTQAAREQSRDPSGRFGTQPAVEADVDLTSCDRESAPGEYTGKPFTATVQPETWQNDYAVSAGPSETFDISGYLHNLDAVGREEFLTDAGGSGILGGYDFLYDDAAARGQATEDYGPYTISVDNPAELREWLEDNPQWVQDGRTPHPTGGYVTREVSTRNGMVTERYLDAEGWLHQEEGPAVRKQDDLGDQQRHYRHGVLHNENGPAVLERSQTSTMRKWYVNGQEVARTVETLSPGWGLENGRPVKETS
jgi:hypothetical protein